MPRDVMGNAERGLVGVFGFAIVKGLLGGKLRVAREGRLEWKMAMEVKIRQAHHVVVSVIGTRRTFLRKNLGAGSPQAI